MINWVKLLQVRLESEEDAPQAIQQIAESLPDNILLNMIIKCHEREHYELVKHLEEEMRKRKLKSEISK